MLFMGVSNVLEVRVYRAGVVGRPHARGSDWVVDSGGGVAHQPLEAVGGPLLVAVLPLRVRGEG